VTAASGVPLLSYTSPHTSQNPAKQNIHITVQAVGLVQQKTIAAAAVVVDVVVVVVYVVVYVVVVVVVVVILP